MSKINKGWAVSDGDYIFLKSIRATEEQAKDDFAERHDQSWGDLESKGYFVEEVVISPKENKEEINDYQLPEFNYVDISKVILPENISRTLIQKCECEGFKQMNGLMFDSEDLYNWGETNCPMCEKPFEKNSHIN